MKFPRSKPCTCLLLYLSFGGFVCGFSYLIHQWPILEKMRKTLSVAILVAIKDLVDNICTCEKQGLVKPIRPTFWKRAWIFLRREVHYFKNK